MRHHLVIAAVLAALTAGPAAADVILHATRLPCIPMEGGGIFCGHTHDIKYLPDDGDEVFLRMHGFQGIQLVGLPPFVREVSTADGRLLRGIPQPGSFTVEMWRDGKRIPTLDMHMRFIPR